MARKKAAQSGGVEDDAAQIRARRERLGISKSELAREAGVSRTTLNAVEAGEGFQRSTYVKIEKTLRDLEHEVGMDAPPPPGKDEGTVTVEVELPDGRTVRVITKGPASADLIADQVAALLQKMSSPGK